MESDDHNADEEDARENVVEHIVSHLMAHDGFDLLERSPPEQVVVQRNTLVPANPLTLALMRVVWRLASIS